MDRARWAELVALAAVHFVGTVVVAVVLGNLAMARDPSGFLTIWVVVLLQLPVGFLTGVLVFGLMMMGFMGLFRESVLLVGIYALLIAGQVINSIFWARVWQGYLDRRRRGSSRARF